MGQQYGRSGQRKDPAQQERTRRYWAQFTPEERKAKLAARLKGRRPDPEAIRRGRLRYLVANAYQQRTRPTERPTLLQIAWAAGVYEGEGSCNASGTSSTRVGVGQKDPWLCDRMRALFGGGVGQTLRNGFTPNVRYWQWTLSGARARGFLMTIYPFLSPRRQRQIRVVLR